MDQSRWARYFFVRRLLNRVSSGPLLWHWENNTTNDPSIELDLEEVKALARAIGFKIEVSSKPSLWYPPT